MKKIIIIATLGLFVSCSENEVSNDQVPKDNHAEKEVDLTSEQISVNDYEIGKPSLQSFSEMINVTGVIDLPPSHRHIISNYMTGYIKKIKVIVGDHVKKGQVLAIIEHQGILELQERYVKAESEKEYLEQEYNRLKKLYEENVVAKKDFLSAKSKFHSIEAQANSLQQQLLLINISPSNVKSGKLSSSYSVLAPANGIISTVNATTGEWVGNEKQLMTLVNPEHIHLELQVFAKDIDKISAGQSIEFGLHGSGDRPYMAHIYRVGVEVKEDRRVLVHAHPDSILKNLTIGAYVEGRILLDSDSLFAIPSTAVTSLDDESFVLIVKDRHNDEVRFQRTPVKILNRSDKWIAIDKKWSEKEFLLNGVFDLIRDEEGGGGGHSH
jgi:cobalt-zinc-cadmium efflux system membrane fusion protein